MKHAYCYIQPSDVEGLSPVLLNVMFLKTPIICSNIRENVFAVDNTALLFEKSNPDSLKAALEKSLENEEEISDLAVRAQKRVISLFTWERVAIQHEEVFRTFLRGNSDRNRP
jgi:glycosyltransferase involved in cell wall biosynthesis